MRFKVRGKPILRVVAWVALIPIIYIVAAQTMPLVEPLVEKVAVYSASLSFASVNSKPFETNFNWDNDDTHFIDMGDGTIDMVYDEIPIADGVTPSPPTIPSVGVEEERPPNSGTVNQKTYTAGSSPIYINLQEGFIKNCTTLPPEKILEAVQQGPSFKMKINQEPEVLIMHTHATEGYQPTKSGYYDLADTARTTDNNKNTVRVGDEIAKQLDEAGIGVIHDKTQHDYPSYNGAYERSAVTINRILKENPTIKVVLDVHRDAIQPSADTMVAPVTMIDGKSAAQIMIISGCDDGTMNMPNYMENLKFSAQLQRQMAVDYDTLARPVLFDYRKYNQNLTTGSILLEMGGHANTLDEAIYSGELVGKALAKVLVGLK